MYFTWQCVQIYTVISYPRAGLLNLKPGFAAKLSGPLNERPNQRIEQPFCIKLGSAARWATKTWWDRWFPESLGVMWPACSEISMWQTGWAILCDTSIFCHRWEEWHVSELLPLWPSCLMSLGILQNVFVQLWLFWALRCWYGLAFPDLFYRGFGQTCRIVQEVLVSHRLSYRDVREISFCLYKILPVVSETRKQKSVPHLLLNITDAEESSWLKPRSIISIYESNSPIWNSHHDSQIQRPGTLWGGLNFSCATKTHVFHLFRKTKSEFKMIHS